MKKKINKTGIIYGLIDPRYGLIRYVGQTTNTLEERFKGHLKEAKRSSQKTYHKLAWIRKLLSLNLKPRSIILAYDISVPFMTHLQIGNKFKSFYDYDALDKEERYFIAITKEECASFGIDCVNGTRGGNGGGWDIFDQKGKKKKPFSEEHKKHIREAQNRPEVIKAKRRVLTEIWANRTQEEKAELSRKNSEAQIKAQNRPEVSKAKKLKMTGRKLSKEHKENIRVSQLGDKNPMAGESIKDHMIPEAFELWKKHVGEASKRAHFRKYIDIVKTQIIESWT